MRRRVEHTTRLATQTHILHPVSTIQEEKPSIHLRLIHINSYHEQTNKSRNYDCHLKNWRKKYLLFAGIVLLCLLHIAVVEAETSSGITFREKRHSGVDGLPYANPNHQYEPPPGARERDKVSEHDYVTPNHQINRHKYKSSRNNMYNNRHNYDPEGNAYQQGRNRQPNQHDLHRKPRPGHKYDLNPSQSGTLYHRRFNSTVQHLKVANAAAVHAKASSTTTTTTQPPLEIYSPAGLKCDFDDSECPWKWDTVDEKSHRPGFEVVSGQMLIDRKKEDDYMYLPGKDYTGSREGEYLG